MFSRQAIVGLSARFGHYNIDQLIVISTCNRTELFAKDCETSDLIDLFVSFTNGTTAEFDEFGFETFGEDAVRHLFEVAVGLDAQILGDLQIIKQVKESYEASKLADLCSSDLHRLMQIVFKTHKRIRKETDLGVGTASVASAAVQFAQHHFKNFAEKHVVLVGKGITFDTGGVSLKRPYDTMTGMKSDMAGAAAILATVIAVSKLAPKVRVTALMMCAENALSGTSQRPSDVIKHYGGTTVEVINTDAEGRLVLADGLAFADKNLDPDYLLDVATLTGAATLGLGRQYGAMYTRDLKLAKKLHEIGEISGDRVWHMPLVDDYDVALESEIADYNHTADKFHFSGGSITAALFLEKFTGKRKWVHIATVVIFVIKNHHQICPAQNGAVASGCYGARRYPPPLRSSRPLNR